MPTPTRLAWMKAWEADLTPSPAELRSRARVAARVSSTRYYGRKVPATLYYGREATARLPEQVPTPGEAALERKPLPELKVVTRRRPRWGMVLLVVISVALLLGACVVAPVMIRAATADLESSLGTLQLTEQKLAAANSRLSAQVSALCSPDRLAEQAARLGLVPAQSLGYVELGPEQAAPEGETVVAGR